MNYRFRVGQMVRIVRSAYPQRIGCVARIVSDLMETTELPSGVVDMRHQLDIPTVEGGPEICAYEPSCLEPYHEPGDFSTLDELIRGVVPAESIASQNQGALVGAHGEGGR